uniref:(northern house mosquito) hypothetical protein n=1 Tax=Culex pipiens TaxID=7175 RepID=A0A8D8FCZ0_CULPI
MSIPGTADCKLDSGRSCRYANSSAMAATSIVCSGSPSLSTVYTFDATNRCGRSAPEISSSTSRVSEKFFLMPDVQWMHRDACFPSRPRVAANFRSRSVTDEPSSRKANVFTFPFFPYNVTGNIRNNVDIVG